MVLSTFEYLEAPFKCIREEINELQNQYVRLEHITQGMSKALDNCRPKNTLWELAKKMDWSKVEALETKKAQLAAQVAAMTTKLVEKSEEIRRDHMEQTVVLNHIQNLVGNTGEVVNQAHMYNRLMKSEELSAARQTLQLLIK